MKKNEIGLDALGMFFPAASLVKQLYELASDALKTSPPKTKNIAGLSEEAVARELEQRIEQANARIAQEYAIAARISESAEVEIEEHYEYVAGAKGGISANIHSGDVSAEIGGASQRVSRRIYRFSGRREGQVFSETT